MDIIHKTSINCKGRLIEFSKPKVMGILNLTPDSFFDGGKHNNIVTALKHCEKIISEGVDFIDLGAYSSKPNAKKVSIEDEKKRLLPVLENLISEFPDALFSIDTFRAEIAAETLDRGAAIINDISAGTLDDKMLATVAHYQVPFIAMHMQGTPSTMQINPKYNNVIDEITYFFSERIKKIYDSGINDLILDPGFGFGKTIAHNFEILNGLDFFQNFGLPVLAGVSRKSMIYKTLNTTPEKALNGTSVLHAVALLKKAQILRVHDVKEAKECIDLIDVLQ